MKKFYLLFLLILLNNCSFDNRSGIWKNELETISKKDGTFKDFIKISSEENIFDRKISLDKNFKFKLSALIINKEWEDIFYKENNNFENFKYNDTNELVYKSKKLTRHKPDDFLLFAQDDLIFTDDKGNIFVFSFNQKRIIFKYNFYKKKYKKIKKKLFITFSENIIFASDNLGYFYALDYKKNKIIWAKNYKVPFNSNLKTLDDKIVASNQINELLFFDRKNGNLLKSIPTEETIVKSQFINNISYTKDKIFFLNSFGSIYSIDKKTFRVNWFLNLNKTLESGTHNLFLGSQIVTNEDYVIISSKNRTYIIDTNSGSIQYKYNFSSLIKPIYNKDYIFLISRNNYLISINIKNGKILYSHNINEQVAKFLNSKKKELELKSLFLVNNELMVFLKNSYILNYKIEGNLEKVEKLKSKIQTFPIIVNGSLIFLGTNNKLSIIN